MMMAIGMLLLFVVDDDDEEDDDDDFNPLMLTVAKKSLTIFIKSCRQKYIWKNS